MPAEPGRKSGVAALPVAEQPPSRRTASRAPTLLRAPASFIQNEGYFLEFLDVVVAALGHGPLEAAEQVELPVGTGGRTEEDLLHRAARGAADAETAAGQRRVASRRVPPSAAGRGALGQRQRLAQHDRVGA